MTDNNDDDQFNESKLPRHERRRKKAKCKDGRANNRPPVASQFKPGESGNLAGRPAKSNYPAEITMKFLTDTVVMTHKSGKKQKIRRIDAINQAMFKDAMGGKFGAQKYFLAYARELEKDPRFAPPPEAMQSEDQQKKAAAEAKALSEVIFAAFRVRQESEEATAKRVDEAYGEILKKHRKALGLSNEPEDWPYPIYPGTDSEAEEKPVTADAAGGGDEPPDEPPHPASAAAAPEPEPTPPSVEGPKSNPNAWRTDPNTGILKIVYETDFSSPDDKK